MGPPPDINTNEDWYSVYTPKTCLQFPLNKRAELLSSELGIVPSSRDVKVSSLAFTSKENGYLATLLIYKAVHKLVTSKLGKLS